MSNEAAAIEAPDGASVPRDLSALSWVQDELKRSLAAAHKALHRHLKEAGAAGGDLDAVDPAILRVARSQLHQSVGVLEMVGLGTPTELMRAAEAALQRLSARPRLVTAEAVRVLEQGGFALLDYIARLLAGRPVSPVALYPQYAALQELAGASRAHPADLWPQAFSWRALPAELDMAPRRIDGDTTAAIEADLLELMRSPAATTAHRLSDRFASLAAGALTGPREDGLRQRQATLWQLAAALLEAQAEGHVEQDLHTKRAGSQLLKQLRAGEAAEPPVRLAHDLLFLNAQANLRRGPVAREPGPRLGAVLRAFELKPGSATDHRTLRLGRHDPAHIAQAGKRVAVAKDAWAAIAGGDLLQMPGLAEPFALVGDSIQNLLPDGAALAHALQAAVDGVQQQGTAPSAELGMEVATALLYVEALLQDGDLDAPDAGDRVQRLARRIDEIRRGRSAGPVEAWMEQLYRRVADRQTLAHVGAELRASLGEIERALDGYVREPARRELLVPVPGHLQAMRGVLSVLGLDDAALAVNRLSDDVDALAATEVNVERARQTGTFERLALNLGALSFLIDMAAVQPAIAKALFRYDPASGNLRAVMAREEPHATFDLWASTPVPPTAPPEPVKLKAPAPAAVPADAPASSPAAASLGNLADHDADHDAEMLAVFHEEADEVLDDAVRHVAHLREQPEDQPTLGHLRRAFHTLKGSSRMVGLTAFGDAAWAGEKLLNERLAGHGAAAPALLDWAADSIDGLRHWSHALREGRPVDGFDPAAWQRSVDALQAQGRHRPVLGEGEPEAVEAFAMPEAAVPPDLAAPAPVADTPAITLELLDAPAAPASFDFELESEPAPAPETASAPAPVPTDLPTFEVIELDLPDALHGDAALPLGFSPAAPAEVAMRAGPDAAAAPPVRPTHPAPARPWDLPVPEVSEASESQLGRFEGLAAPSPAPVEGSVHPLQPLAEPVVDLDSTTPQPAARRLLDTSIVEAWSRQPPAFVPAVEPEPQPDPVQVETPPLAATPAEPADPLGLGPSLRPIFLREADETLGRLARAWHAWRHRPLDGALAEAAANAHALGGSSSAVGFQGLATLARGVEHVLERGAHHGDLGVDAVQAVDEGLAELQRLMADFHAGRLAEPASGLLTRLQAVAPRGVDAAAPASGLLDLDLALQGSDDLDLDLDLPSPAAASSASSSALIALDGGMPWRASDVEPVPAPAEGLAAVEASSPSTPTPLPDVVVAPMHIDLSPPSTVPAPRVEAAVAVPPAAAGQPAEDEVAAPDAASVDAELFPIFSDEADDLLREVQARLRDWQAATGEAEAATASSACMRALHTFKGSARLAGAASLGDRAHSLETAVEQLAGGRGDTASARPAVAALLAEADQLVLDLEWLQRGVAARGRRAGASASSSGRTAVAAPSPVVRAARAPAPAPAALPTPFPAPRPVTDGAPRRAFNWRAFRRQGAVGGESPFASTTTTRLPSPAAVQAAQGIVRVRAPVLDRLVNHAGEVAFTRARIDADLKQFKAALVDLGDNLDRLRMQLREVELQAETQMGSRLEAARAAAQEFDPLEMDRFTRLQELTRMMAESVGDVATVQRGLHRTLQSTEDALAHQGRMTRDMQEELLRTRMVEFEGLAERLHRVARQAAKETGKEVELRIEGGAVEVDRAVLERMTPAFEHLLRNAVVHGIELPQARLALGKPATGELRVALSQVGNEVQVDVADDGAGLQLERIRERAAAAGVIDAGAQLNQAELGNLIFEPGVTTADQVTEVAGRGVGMDVVRTDVHAMGGRIETESQAGRGTRFRLVLPLTTAVTQVVALRLAGGGTVAVPSTLVESVRRLNAADLAKAYADGRWVDGDGHALPFHWLDGLLGGSVRGEPSARGAQVVIARSADQRVALHVEDVLGNQEVVVKHLGPQLSRLPGLVGMTLMASGVPAPIYNPLALAALHGDAAHAAVRALLDGHVDGPALAARSIRAPLVLVVDDSLTVRRVTQRLLEREGYRVALAKDGQEGLDRLAGELPAAVLSDIEMPQMDGFEMVRQLRAQPRLAHLPVIMITSRIAPKHREYARELGVQHYLGKPYAEDELLTLLARETGFVVAEL